MHSEQSPRILTAYCLLLLLTSFVVKPALFLELLQVGLGPIRQCLEFFLQRKCPFCGRFSFPVFNIHFPGEHGNLVSRSSWSSFCTCSGIKPLGFLHARCPSCHPTKAVKGDRFLLMWQCSAGCSWSIKWTGFVWCPWRTFFCYSCHAWRSPAVSGQDHTDICRIINFRGNAV